MIQLTTYHGQTVLILPETVVGLLENYEDFTQTFVFFGHTSVLVRGKIQEVYDLLFPNSPLTLKPN